MRTGILAAACHTGVDECLKDVGKLFMEWIKSPDKYIHPDLRPLVYRVGKKYFLLISKKFFLTFTQIFFISRNEINRWRERMGYSLGKIQKRNKRSAKS